ncbi:MAG: ABC transporter permease subunit [Planctomycetota bacterium]
MNRSGNRLFWAAMIGCGTAYLLLILSMLLADFQYVGWDDVKTSLADRNIQYSIWLSLASCTIASIVSMWIAIPTGYVLARLGRDTIERRLQQRPWLRRVALFTRYLVDTVLDIPIVLPPLVIGISLLVLFQSPAGRWCDTVVHSITSAIGISQTRGVTYEVPAVILAQLTVAAAFAIRTMRRTFEQISSRPEQIALTLGASHYQAFSRVALPQAWRGGVAAFTLAWARSLGEFGPILIFAGTTRMKTEVLSTTVYLNFQMGNLRGAVSASLILVTVAVVVLIVTRMLTLNRNQRGSIE